MSWRNKSVSTRRGLWCLSSAVGVLTPDDSGYGNHGTMVNAPTFARTPWGLASMEFDGDDAYVNLGDLGYLNAVGAFTIVFWMNQDILSILDFIFTKFSGGMGLQIYTFTDGKMYFDVYAVTSGRSSFTYTTLMPAGSWHHLAYVFDGSQAGDANRFVAYVDGTPVTLAFPVAAVPAVTDDQSGQDATIGRSIDSFNGKLFDFQIHDVPLTRDEINLLMRGR